MKLTIFNGSHRGKGSNTKVLLENFISGFSAKDGNTYELAYLNHLKELDRNVEIFSKSETVLLAFPLYTDCMPYIVKIFIENLESLCGKENNPSLGFIVHSGFPEAVHSRYVERYLIKLSKRLGCKYLGTIIKGGSEGIKDQPQWMTKKTYKSFLKLGKIFGETGKFDEKIINKLAKPEKYSRLSILIVKIVLKMSDSYWNKMLKKNNAFEKRFDKPFIVS